MSMARCFKSIAVIGAGRMGQIRMQQMQLIEGLKLTGIVESTSDIGKLYGNRYNVPYFETVSELMNGDNKIDGIWIASPTGTHGPLIHEIVNLNNDLDVDNKIKCIGTEKPVSMTAKVTEECYNICEKNNVMLYCSFQRRVDPHFQRLYKSILNGDLGRIETLNSILRDHPTPPIENLLNDGDIFHDAAVHDIDFARSINKNSEIVYVFAVGNSMNKKLSQKNILNDIVKAICVFDNNVMHHIEISRTSTYGYDIQFECFGSKAGGKIENINETSYQYQNENGIQHDKYQYSFPQRFEHAFRSELEHFYDILSDNNIKPMVNVIDSCRATQVAEACRLSILNEKPIYITYDENVPSICHYHLHMMKT